MKTLNYRDAGYMLIVMAGLLTGYVIALILNGSIGPVDASLADNAPDKARAGCRTVLHDAAMQGDMTRLKAYLGREKLHRMLAERWWGATPLHLAAGQGHAEAAAFLIEQGADMEAPDAAGRTPLHAAALNGHEGVVLALLAAGADATAHYKVFGSGYTARRCAVAAGHDDLARLLTDVEPVTEAAGPPEEIISLGLRCTR